MAARLSDLERAERALTEAQFQEQVTNLAESLGWTWAHFRALQNRRGQWQVPVEGPLGVGWPDLVLLRVRDRRLIFAELKRELGTASLEQATTLAALGELAIPDLVRTGLVHPFRMALAPEPGGVCADCGSIRNAARHTRLARVDAYLWRPSDLREPIEIAPIYLALR